MPGVHAVLTHDDVPGEKRYGLEFADQPVLAIERVRYFGEPIALVAAEHPEQARRAAARIEVEYEPLEPVVDPERALEQEPIHPQRWTEGHGYRDDPRPNVVRSIVIRHGDPDAAGDVSVSGVYELGIQDQAFLGPESGLAVPDGEGGVDVYVATQWLHVDRDQVAPCLGLDEGAGAHPPRRRRRRVRRPRGPVDADPRRDARAAHEPAGEDGLQPRGVVLRPRPPAPRADLVRAPREPRRQARQRAHADPARRRRLRLQLDGRRLERVLVRDRPLRGRERAARGHLRLHEQPALRRDARVRRRPDLLRGRGADGQARRRARARPGRAAAPERARAGRHAADRPEGHRLDAGRRGDPRGGGAAAARARAAAARRDPPARRRRQHDPRRRRPARRRLRGRLQEHLLLGGLRRLLHRPRASCARTAAPRSTAPRPRSARA